MEEKQKGGFLIKLVLAIVGSCALCAAVGYVLLLLFMHFLPWRKWDGLEDDKEEFRKSFRENLQKYYGLGEGDYTITEEKYAGLGRVIDPVYYFTVGGKNYISAGSGESQYTDYYQRQFFNAAKEQIRRTVEGSGMLSEENFAVRINGCTFRDWEENYLRRADPSLLPMWINEEEIARFSERNADKARYLEEIDLSCDILLKPTKELKLTKEQFSAIRDELYFVKEFNFYTEDVIYHYNPKTDELTKERR